MVIGRLPAKLTCKSFIELRDLLLDPSTFFSVHVQSVICFLWFMFCPYHCVILLNQSAKKAGSTSLPTVTAKRRVTQ